MHLGFTSPVLSFRPTSTTSANNCGRPTKRWRCAINPPQRGTTLASTVHVYRHNETAGALPTLVYLPGLDSRPLPPFQLEGLDGKYYVVSILLRTGDERQWDALASSILDAAPPGCFTLVGESFGAALALRVAAKGGDRVSRLILLNSGTALLLLPLQQLGTFTLPILGVPPLYRLAAAAITPFLTSYDHLHSEVRFADGGRALFDVENTPLPDVLHRVGLLQRFNEDFGDECVASLITQPTVLVASASDNLLPSVREATRLKRLLNNVEKMVVLPDAPHASLLDRRFSLFSFVGDPEMAAVSNEARDTSGDYVSDSEYAEAYRTGRNFFAPWRSLVSPWVGGLDNVREALSLAEQGARPGRSTRPILFVGNHGKYGILDLSLLYGIIADELHGHVAEGGSGSKRLRGLADHSHFTQFDAWSEGQWAPFVRALGGVPASARAFYSLLRQGERVLLFPGGAREVCRRRGEEYLLVWGEETEFVRPSAKFDAVIVPLSCVGADDDAPTLLDGLELQELPGFGRILKDAADKAGFDRQNLFPLSGIPSCDRYYFCFHAPIDTRSVDETDVQGCAAVYNQVKCEVRDGIDALLQRREVDPKRKLMNRVAIDVFERFDS